MNEKSSGSRSRKQGLTAVGTRCADHVKPLYPQKLALTLPTGSDRSVGIVRVRTKATEFSFIRNIAMIQCYAPTAVAEEDERQEFYVQLSEVLRKQKRRDIIILGGDLNAKVGQENEGLEHIWADMVWEKETKMDNF